MPVKEPTYVYLLGPLTLELWQVATNGRTRYAYRLFDQDFGLEPVFEADDFKMPSWATYEEASLDIISYLVLQSDEVEGWFFKDYTPEQLRWRDERGPIFRPLIEREVRRLMAEPKVKHLVGTRRKRK